MKPKFDLTINLSSVKVTLGEHDLANDTDGAEPLSFAVTQRLIHFDYNSRTYDNDIALVKFEGRLEFSKKISPICLPFMNDKVQEETWAGDYPYIAGWGSTKFRGPTSSELLEIQLKVRFRCNLKLLQSFTTITNFNDNVCAWL